MTPDQPQAPVRVLALSYKQHGHYRPLYGHDGVEIEETSQWEAAVIREKQPDIVLTLANDAAGSYVCVQAARELSIPSLLIMDGMLEWRHQWTHPKFGAGEGVPYDQPIVTDKVACLGWASARTLESWGNLGQCEIVGVPRFDHYLAEPVELVPHDGPHRLLVMTANTPGFTPEQITLAERALRDVAETLAANGDWEPIWRVRGGLDEKLGLQDSFPELKTQSLKAAFAQADAVLTTPSTVLLESMLAGLPTAILDYTNSPPYVPAAWTVTAPDHLDPTLADFRDPDPARLVYQDEILHNNLECRTPATPRMIALIRAMAQIGRDARQQGNPLEFPARLLPLDQAGIAPPSEHFNFAALYPHHPVFANRDLHALQLELVQTRKQLQLARAKLAQRRLGFWIGLAAHKVAGRIRKR